MKRSLSEILKEADDTDSLARLEQLWNELKTNRHQYPLVEYLYGKEHLEALYIDLYYEIKKMIHKMMNTN